MLDNNLPKLNVETILPFGDNLRPLVSSSRVLSDNDLKSFLSSKGIFTSSNDRNETVPLITMSLLSPLEFEVLLEKQKDKESQIKRRNRDLEWLSDKPLFEALKGINIPLKDLIPQHSSSYEIISQSPLRPVNGDPNHLSCDFEIERTDRSKDMYTQHSLHKGYIELKLSDDKKLLNIAMEHTAEETHEVNEKCTRYLRDILLRKNCISNKETQKVTFNDFDNAARVRFFLNLLNTSLDKSDTFEFLQITNVEISVDAEKPLPEGIKWMERKIDNMKFKGRAIHETELLRDPKYHNSLILSSVRANYDFKSLYSTGSCTFEFGFPARGNIPQPNTEFIYKLLNFNFESKTKAKNKVQGFLYAKFDEFKTIAYKVTKGEKVTQ
ncbi:GapS4b family protein [Paenibacillus macerans]|uniref:GAPS4b N-terminal domain-containing protein n=1 Tax=Paenibacillus macerans TaxID=44252 RepID=A0A090ZPJ5_PAEMA|nr:hypothetical protein [Paenibacillus macerans]KFN12170.1 hypothetical protein DJ90_2002 [Paenibacillus macerans]MCY7558502.1 hypothetical protein [Paenibacillus macerans]MEC0150268.1 hypothetical protein [Paenibacillus macerans]SUA84387.1 Uncharacterised protein [Paenibacillus macerans]